MNIHIKGGTLENKGDELMLRTVVDRFSRASTPHKLSVYHYFCPYEMRCRLGLHQTLWRRNMRRFDGLVGHPIIKKYRKTLGVIPPEELDWSLDISGFCYTDYWGDRNAVHMSRFMEEQAACGTKFILLPQAFGPFEKGENRPAFQKMAGYAELIFARDRSSLQYLRELKIDADKIHLAPDLTTLSPLIVPEWITPQFGPFTSIIPNSRIIEQNEEEKAKKYLDFLAKCIDYNHSHGRRSILLLFEQKDTRLIEQLTKLTKSPFFHYKDLDPRVSKGIISKSEYVIGSRYHSLVSSLSQGVPSLGTAWSHKYIELFDDYNCPDYIITDFEAGIQKIEQLLDKSNYILLKKDILASAETIRNRSLHMWEKIEKVTGIDGLSNTSPATKGIQNLIEYNHDC